MLAPGNPLSSLMRIGPVGLRRSKKYKPLCPS